MHLQANQRAAAARRHPGEFKGWRSAGTAEIRRSAPDLRRRRRSQPVTAVGKADKGSAVRIDQRERLVRKQLRKLLPVNKDDVAAIEAITAQGYPAVQPILLDLLKWIRDESWPVAKPAREFLVAIGPRLAP